MHMVQIHFDTATYDEIEKDKKITLEAQLGLIGGTMGLLTGFSILSGVEIIYFIFRFFYLLGQPGTFSSLQHSLFSGFSPPGRLPGLFARFGAAYPGNLL